MQTLKLSMEAWAVELLEQGPGLWGRPSAGAGLRLELIGWFLWGAGLPCASLAASSASALISCWEPSMLLLLWIQFHLWRKGRLCRNSDCKWHLLLNNWFLSLWELGTEPGNVKCSLLMLLCPVGTYCIAWGGESRVSCIQADTFLGLDFDSAPFFPFQCIKVNTEALFVVPSTVPQDTCLFR